MKKHLLFFFLLFSSFFFFSTQLFSQSNRAIALTSVAPTIDGNVDGIWVTSQAPIYSIGVLVSGSPTNNPAGRWRGMYDNNNFYFLLEITDTDKWGNSQATPRGNSYWNGDAVEICIKRGGAVASKCQIGLSYAKDASSNPLRYGDYTAGAVAMKDVSLNYDNKPGYVIEMRIPKSDMLLGSLTTGDELMMEICVSQATSTGKARVAQLASFVNSPDHYDSYDDYTALVLTDFSQPAPDPDEVVVKALGNKKTICSNGIDFASLVVNSTIPTGATVTYLWKKDGVQYTGKGAGWNNIRPTAAGSYTCDVTINGELRTSNAITISATNLCADMDNKTNMPIFIVNTNGQGFPSTSAKTKRSCDVKVIWGGAGSYNKPSDMANNADVHYDRKAIMNYRGSTSRDMAKKPYAFACGKKDLINGEIEKGNFSLLNLPEEKDWILYPSYGDKSMMRNKLAMELYKDMGYYASSMNYVDLYIDGDYKGVYILMEKYERDDNRLNVFKDFEGSTPGEIGYIVKLDKTEHADDAICWERTKANCGGDCGVGGCGSSSYNTPMRYELVYPKDDTPNYASKKAYIQDFISRFETALNNASNAQDFDYIYENYIDMQSFADYFIIAELAKVSDAYRLSMWFTKDANGRLKCSPIWDYDMGFGNSTTHGSFDTNTWQYNHQAMNETVCPIPFWWNKLRTNACFNNAVRTRWESLRRGVLSNAGIEGKINASMSQISVDIDAVPYSSPMGRNKTRWSWEDINLCTSNNYTCPWHMPSWPANYISGYAGGKTTSLSSHEVPLMKKWIENRLVWLDAQISNNSFGTVLTDEQFIDCCKITEEDITVKKKEIKAGTNGIELFCDQQTITVRSMNEQDPIQSIFVYDADGSLLTSKSNIKDTYCQLKNSYYHKKMVIVKVLTLQSSESKMLMIR